MVKTKITLNDGTKKKYESDAAFGVAITEVGNEDTLTELYVCGNTDAFSACAAATHLIREMRTASSRVPLSSVLLWAITNPKMLTSESKARNLAAMESDPTDRRHGTATGWR